MQAPRHAQKRPDLKKTHRTNREETKRSEGDEEVSIEKIRVEEHRQIGLVRYAHNDSDGGEEERLPPTFCNRESRTKGRGRTPDRDFDIAAPFFHGIDMAIHTAEPPPRPLRTVLMPAPVRAAAADAPKYVHVPFFGGVTPRGLPGLFLLPAQKQRPAAPPYTSSCFGDRERWRGQRGCLTALFPSPPPSSAPQLPPSSTYVRRFRATRARRGRRAAQLAAARIIVHHV